MAKPPKPILASLNSAQIAHAKSMLDRFVDRSGGPDACWPWTGGSFTRGYGVFHTLDKAKNRRMIKAHRLVFELAHDGACPPVVDHVCHDNADCDLGELCLHRRCCNPSPLHLGASTLGDNLSRALLGIHQEVCNAGHLMDDGNTYVTPGGSWRCRKCAAVTARATRQAVALRHRDGPLRIRPAGQSRREAVEWALAGQDPDACMYWPGVKPSRDGYVEVGIESGHIAAHRLVYEVKTGAIPDGYLIDHTCHEPAGCEGGMECPHRACIHPGHLVAATYAKNGSRERSSRKRLPSCAKGHEYTEANTYVDRRGTRHCRTCQADRQRDDRAAAKAAPDWIDGRRRDGNMCVQGHDVTVTGLNSQGRCAECDRVRGREAYAVQHAADLADPTRVDGRKRQGDLCRNGHDVTVTGLTKRGTCRKCKRISDLASVARRTSGSEPRESNLCRNGHDVTVTGLNTQGVCAECARAWRQEYSPGRWAAMGNEPGLYRRAEPAA